MQELADLIKYNRTTKFCDYNVIIIGVPSNNKLLKLLVGNLDEDDKIIILNSMEKNSEFEYDIFDFCTLSIKFDFDKKINYLNFLKRVSKSFDKGIQTALRVDLIQEFFEKNFPREIFYPFESKSVIDISQKLTIKHSDLMCYT